MANLTCEELSYYPSFSETFLECPSISYIIFSSLNLFLAIFQIAVFLHLLYIAHVERGREVPYLVSLAPICSTISVLELFNPSTMELLSAFRFVYLVFCILQFYQYLVSYYGDWEDLVRVLPGFVYEARICCWCCRYVREISITRTRIYSNKGLVYTGVITYIIVVMVTEAFVIEEVVEDCLLTLGVILFITGMRATKRFISITQQFYPELSAGIQRKWIAVRLCFVVIGLQGFLLKAFNTIHLIWPIGLFNKGVMVDVIHNMLVPLELTFAVILAHRAFHAEYPDLMERTPLLPKQQRGNSASQTDHYNLLDAISDTKVRVDSGVDSPDFEYVPGYGSLSNEMMDHVEQAIEDTWRRSHSGELYQGEVVPGTRGELYQGEVVPGTRGELYQGEVVPGTRVTSRIRPTGRSFTLPERQFGYRAFRADEPHASTSL